MVDSSGHEGSLTVCTQHILEGTASHRHFALDDKGEAVHTSDSDPVILLSLAVLLLHSCLGQESLRQALTGISTSPGIFMLL